MRANTRLQVGGALLLALAWLIYQATPVEHWQSLNRAFFILGVSGAIVWALLRAYGALRRRRVAIDLPTSTIRGAAQGYVEFFGEARTAAEPLRCPVGGEPCLWWELNVLENLPFRRELRRIVADSSDEPFLLEDATGRCYVAPAGARVVGAPTRHWHGFRRRPETVPPHALRLLSRVLLWPAFNVIARVYLFLVVANVILQLVVAGAPAVSGAQLAVVAYCLVTMTLFRFRYELRTLPPRGPLYALGEFNSSSVKVDGRAVEAIARPTVAGQEFILSTRRLG